MNNNVTIRLAAPADYPAMLQIYAPYVLSTAITFEYDVPSLTEFTERIKTISAHYPCLVCEADGVIAGYTYSGIHRVKAAYQWSTESTIYTAAAWHGKGIAQLLYQTLFATLKLQGFINVYGGVTTPNPQSEAFHLKSGFTEIGRFEKIGYKFNRWHDIKFFQLILNEHADNPKPPVSITAIKDSEAFRKILAKANKKQTAL